MAYLKKGTAFYPNTVTAGTIGSGVTFPAGHVIKTSSIQAEDVAEITTSSTGLEDSGLVVAHTTGASSTNSYLTFEAYSGMGYIGTVNKRGLLDVCVTSDSATAYNADDSICNSTFPWFLKCVGDAPWYVPLYFKGVCGLETGMGMPADISSWDAGDTLYFRMFDAVDGGTFRFCHGNTCYSLTVKEVAR
tara:strand:- start:686 stop:1255 length:570 start_codon:yes stop_codon:yes gene_type:complete